MIVVLFIIIGVVALSIPGLLIARLAAAKRREERVGSPSTFTETSDPGETLHRSTRDR